MPGGSARVAALRRLWPWLVAWMLCGLSGAAVMQTLALWWGEPGEGFVAGTFSEWLGGVLGTSDGTISILWTIFAVIVVGTTVWWVPHAARLWPWERPKRPPPPSKPAAPGKPGTDQR